jgi:phage shock protein A
LGPKLITALCPSPHPQQIQLDAQRKALDQLQANVRVLEGKLGEARNKRETLKARAATAKSSKQIQEVS